MKLQLGLVASIASLIPALIYYLITHKLPRDDKGLCVEALVQYGNILTILFIVSAIIMFIIGWTIGGAIEKSGANEVTSETIMTAVAENRIMLGIFSITTMAIVITQLYGIYLLFNANGRDCARNMNNLWIANFIIFLIGILGSLFGGSR